MGYWLQVQFVLISTCSGLLPYRSRRELLTKASPPPQESVLPRLQLFSDDIIVLGVEDGLGWRPPCVSQHSFKPAAADAAERSVGDAQQQNRVDELQPRRPAATVGVRLRLFHGKPAK